MGHCGECLPCTIRKAAIKAAGLNDATVYRHHYETEIGFESLQSYKLGLATPKDSYAAIQMSGPITDHINDYYSLDKKIFRNYVIFASIACFPFGLLSIIPYVILTGNNVKVKTTEVKDSETISEGENKDNSNDIKVEDVKGQDNITSETVTEVKVENPETEEEKQEKFKKLQNFKEKGLITDDELEMAREQLFGKKEDK